MMSFFLSKAILCNLFDSELAEAVPVIGSFCRKQSRGHLWDKLQPISVQLPG